MTEDEAKAWIRTHFNVSRETLDRLETYADMLAEENQKQNLIAPSTVPQIWARHIVDSAQLLLYTDLARSDGIWLDLGSGAGLPGLVVALLSSRHVMLTESRKLRCEFLRNCIDALGLEDRVTLFVGKVEQITELQADVISARAFAPLPKLLKLAHGLSHKDTRWLLPKGQNAAKEYEAAKRDWALYFQLKQSVTSPDSHILVGTLRGPRK